MVVVLQSVLQFSFGLHRLSQYNWIIFESENYISGVSWSYSTVCRAPIICVWRLNSLLELIFCLTLPFKWEICLKELSNQPKPSWGKCLHLSFKQSHLEVYGAKYNAVCFEGFPDFSIVHIFNILDVVLNISLYFYGHTG